MTSYAPQHRIYLLPLKLFKSDRATAEMAAIYLDTGQVAVVDERFVQQIGIDLTNDVFSIETRKSLDLAPGSFSMYLIDAVRPSYTDLIQPNDIMLIQLDNGVANGRLENVMLGLVSRVAKTTTINDNHVSHYIEISGQDMARWLYVGRTFFWFYAGVGSNAKDGVAELADRQQAFLNYFPNQGRSNLPSAEILKNILLGYIGEFFPRVKEVFQWNPIPTMSVEAQFVGNDPILGFGEKYIPNLSLDGYEGSFANLLLDHQFEYFGELWSDTTPDGGFAINYRRVPFDESDWYSFSVSGGNASRRHHFISDDAIIGINVARGDEQYYNFISVIPWIYSPTSITRLVIDSTKRLDLSSIKDRGVRQLFITSKYLDSQITDSVKTARLTGSFHEALENEAITMETPNSTLSMTQVDATARDIQNKTGPIYQIADDWAGAAWRWYSQLDRYYTGRVKIHGSPTIRVGHKIELPGVTNQGFQTPYHFYVVAVHHSYNTEQGHFTTELELTRGQPAEAFIRPSLATGTEQNAEAEAAKTAGTLANTNPVNPRPFANGGINSDDPDLRDPTWREY